MLIEEFNDACHVSFDAVLLADVDTNASLICDEFQKQCEGTFGGFHACEDISLEFGFHIALDWC